MKIVDREIDNHKQFFSEKKQSNSRATKSKLKESNKFKSKGRISAPRDEKEAKVQPNYQDLRKMPFSLADEDIDQINSPMLRVASIEDEWDHPNSLQMEAQNDNQFVDYWEDKIYQSFDIFQEDDLSRIDDNESEQIDIKNNQNNIIDNSNLYLNLSNKVSFPDAIIHKAKGKWKDYNPKNALQTTMKSNHQTGANMTYTECIKIKKNRKQLIHQETHEISVDTLSDNKSHSLNKVNFYSEFDDRSEWESNNTEVNRSSANDKQFKNINAGVIKGFCSSVSSSQSIINHDVFTPEKEVDLKRKFYDSGIGFQNTDSQYNSNPRKNRKVAKIDKTQIYIQNRLSFNSEEEMSKTYESC